MYRIDDSLYKECKNLLYIAIGAFPAGLIRWQFNNISAVNIIGAFLLGFIFGLPFKRNIRLIIGVGFCGALTTFSGWIMDTFELLVDGFFAQALGLIFYSLGFGFLAMILGFLLGRRLTP